MELKNIKIHPNIRNELSRLVKNKNSSFTSMKSFAEHHLRIAIAEEWRKIKSEELAQLGQE